MRRRAILAAASLLTACLALRASGAFAARAFELIVYDFKQRTADTVDYATYHANLRSQVLAADSFFGDEVPTLALLPENTGLMAWLVGPRGEAARGAADSGEPDSSAAAIAALGPQYATAVSFYQAKCPGIPPARALVLALTDTAWRALIEETVRIANSHGIWIMTSLNTPDVTVTRDPATVAALADPDLAAAGYAYEGGCEAWNVAMLIPPTAALDPDGAADPAEIIAGQQKKVYLVPVERAQDVGLALSSESPANVRVIETPFARLGILTSKDAWMPDVAERLEIDGMEVFVQPEAGAWAGRGAGLPDWPPDAMARAIWGMVQLHAETRIGALPNLTGNFGDLYFDGTATITADAVFAEIPARYLLGRAPQPGIVARASWVFPDPPPGVALADISARRAFLDANGARLLPGSGDPLENGQLSGFVAARITLPDPAPPRPRVARGAASSIPVAPSPAPQWAPAAAGDDDSERVFAVWTDLRDGHEQPYVARSLDGGATWTAAVKAGDAAARPLDQQDNQYGARILRAADGTLHLIWADFRNQSWDIYAARSMDDGATWSPSVRVDGSPSTGEGFPNENLHQAPVLAALPSGRLLAAWADARGTRTDHGIRAAFSDDGGASWHGDVSVDGTDAVEAEQWAPVLAVTRNGRVAAAWQDHRDGINQIYFASSQDEGECWSEAIALAASSNDQWQPAIAAGRGERVYVAWSEARDDGGRRIRAVRVNRRGRIHVLEVERDAPGGVRQARPSLVLQRGRRAWIAWQDDRAGDWDVLASRLRRRAPRRGPFRVDDGAAGAHARLPVLFTIGRRGIGCVWEEQTGDTQQVRITRFD